MKKKIISNTKNLLKKIEEQRETKRKEALKETLINSVVLDELNRML